MSPGYGLAPVAFVLLLHCACTPGPFDPADGPWQGKITTEGNVTTVVNESGSVWDGMERLVEEASIGVDVGADEYMFGRVAGVWVTDDRVLVLDAFGGDGRFLGTVSLDHYPGNAFIDGETIAMAVTDDAGTIMVKRYRLVLPGEDEE